jgi:hypothetical protein
MFADQVGKRVFNEDVAPIDTDDSDHRDEFPPERRYGASP